MAEHLREISKIYSLLEDSRRSAVYSKAAYSLEKSDPSVGGKIKGIGPSITKDLQEFYETGTSMRMVELKTNNKELLTCLELFCSIHGIGIKYAKQLWLAGYRTLDDLKKGNALSEVQKKALEQADDLKERIPREEIATLEKVLRKIWHFDFEITGSYRRGLASSGDIDVLVKNVSIDDAVLILVDCGIIESDLAIGKSKYMGTLIVPGYKTIRRIDVMHIPEDSWPYAILYFTGSKEFNINMRQQAKMMGFRLNEFGIVSTQNGEVVKGLKTEEDVFKFLNLQYVAPNKR